MKLDIQDFQRANRSDRAIALDKERHPEHAQNNATVYVNQRDEAKAKIAYAMWEQGEEQTKLLHSIIQLLARNAVVSTAFRGTPEAERIGQRSLGQRRTVNLDVDKRVPPATGVHIVMFHMRGEDIVGGALLDGNRDPIRFFDNAREVVGHLHSHPGCDAEFHPL